MSNTTICGEIMWREPIREKGARESPYAHDVKLVLIKAKYQDTYNELTLKEIINDFQHYVELTSYPWEHYTKDGEFIEPNYETVITNWITKYKFHECYAAYEHEMIATSKEEAMLIYDKKLKADTITDFKTIERIDKRIDSLFNQQDISGMDHTYKIAKLEETKNSIWHRICERLGLNKETEETAPELVPVDDNPVWESDDFLESRRDMLWSLVNKRGDD